MTMRSLSVELSPPSVAVDPGACVVVVVGSPGTSAGATVLAVVAGAAVVVGGASVVVVEARGRVVVVVGRGRVVVVVGRMVVEVDAVVLGATVVAVVGAVEVEAGVEVEVGRVGSVCAAAPDPSPMATAITTTPMALASAVAWRRRDSIMGGDASARPLAGNDPLSVWCQCWCTGQE
jgi:hypothetical protein